MDGLLPKIGRYIGVAKSFRTYPSDDLPKTIYTKDPLTNVLIPSDVVHRTVKEDSWPLRGFGMRKAKRWAAKHHHKPSRRRPQGAALEPLRGDGGRPNAVPVHFGDTTPASPTPTTALSPAQHPIRSGPPNGIIAISIACLIVGLALLGLSAWAIYRRRTRRSQPTPIAHTSQDVERGPYSQFDPETPTHHHVTPSVPRGTPRMSALWHLAIFSKPNWATHSTNLHTPDHSAQKRAAFVHLASPDTVLYHERLYSPPVRDSPVESRVWQARIEPDSPGQVHFSPRSPRSSSHSIATLERIEEEAPPTTPAGEPVKAPARRPMSMDTMMTAGTRSSAYTTASARSSISDLTTLSTISCLSSFPETPKDSDPVLSNGIKTSKSFGKTSRGGRTRSQTVTSVKHVGLRTAVGRTMSLQPTKQEMEALHRIQSDDIEALDALRALRALEELEAEMEIEEKADDPDRPVMGDLHTNTPALNRANTCPAKLLSRRQAQATREVRKSEVISGGQFKEALQIFRVNHQPRLDQSFPSSPTESENTEYIEAKPTEQVQEWDSTAELGAYYVGSDGEFEYGYFDDEASGSVPHIKVTSH